MVRAPVIATCLLALAAWPGAAQEGAFLTEPAGCDRPARYEFGFGVLAAEPDFLTSATRTRWDLGVMRGARCLDGAAEFELEWVAQVAATGDLFVGGVSDFGDVTIRGKLRLARANGGRPELAARFSTTLPQTSFGNGLGRNTLRFHAQLLATWPARRVKVHANLGVALLDEALRAHEQRDLLAYGLQAAMPLGAKEPRLELVVESAGQLGEGSPGADARAEMRAGVRQRRGRWTWSAALRHGLLEADGTWGLAAFLSFSPRSAPAPPDPEPAAPQPAP
jgi:hypothetical protein